MQTLKPAAAVLGAFFCQQHIHHLVGLVACTNCQLHETSRVAVHGGFTQLLGVHFTEAFEACHSDLALLFFCFDTVEDTFPLALIQRVKHFLADIDSIQWRHRDIDMAGQNQFAEMANAGSMLSEFVHVRNIGNIENGWHDVANMNKFTQH